MLAARRLTVYGCRWSAARVTTRRDAECGTPEWVRFGERCAWTRNSAAKGDRMVGMHQRALAYLFSTPSMPVPAPPAPPRSLSCTDDGTLTYMPAATPPDAIDDELRAIASTLHAVALAHERVEIVVDLQGIVGAYGLVASIQREQLFSALDLFVSLPCKVGKLVVRKPEGSGWMVDGFLSLAKRAFSPKMRARIVVESVGV